MPPLFPDAVWQIAITRWSEIGVISPDLLPAIELQQRLVRLMLEASASLDEPLPGHMTPDFVGEKWRRGIPALRGEPLGVPAAVKVILKPICAALAEGGAGDSARHIGRALALKQIDADSLISVSLARRKAAVRTSALHMDMSPDLVWLVGELASAPLAHHFQGRLRTALGGAQPEWDRGYCLMCGSWPAFIELNGQNRALRCSFCSSEWTLTSRRCVYCDYSGGDLVEAAPDMQQPERRVELCGACGSYTKVLETAAATPFPLIAVEDLASTDLDQGAMSRGYLRPDLIDLDALDPAGSAGCA